jgi:hypothetical protein
MMQQQDDRVIATSLCRTCGRPFAITAGEWAYLCDAFGQQARTPRVCLPCRRARRRQAQEEAPCREHH